MIFGANAKQETGQWVCEEVMHVASTCFQMQEIRMHRLCYDWMDEPHTSQSDNVSPGHFTMFRSVAWRCLLMQPHDDINASL